MREPLSHLVFSISCGYIVQDISTVDHISSGGLRASFTLDAVAILFE